MRSKQIKMFSHAKETLFTRKGRTVKDLKTGKETIHKYVNQAKRQTRELVDKNGQGSVMVLS